MTGQSLFVLGGARSGKSQYAQARAEAIAGRHILVATAEARDAEMRDRIARHRADRDQRWRTVEAPRDLAAAIDAANGADAVALVDRSAERRGGNEGGSTGRIGRSRAHKNKKKQ